ncbi:two-component sensor histidine kinase [Sulfurimonas gotlandica GD1]|uniref:histidine kinase n=1 Tax=Sulfurimonas gotlandica (strain DSM 19862 / JCM 16533 / GD1) TaxID=929558 RepID=B6BMX4_SULGG|nr:ArsS family sensor histidine kinase [Sulfurimonas gotlandica]EDZ61462.1 two-component system histidine kinase [Sulfurimonas gotlandica GD1]EHP30753.1 two-component sensor histidine kinase [Sulfurimonas gotlandica GD1]
MNKNSIIFTITITFIIALVLVLVSFGILYKVSEKREDFLIVKRNMEATNMFFREFKHGGLTKKLEEDLKLINYSIISDQTEQNKILNDPNLKHSEVETRGRGRAKIQQLRLADISYVYIHTIRGNVILLNNNQAVSHKGTILIVFIVIFLTFIFLFINTLNKLRPLNILKDKVQNFGDEEFDVSCSSDKKDEISLLANEFDKSAKKLKKLKESRNIFIRNIMHELKTPITKGKFLTELPQTSENNEKMQKVFYRLETLINEFASIEELMSTKKVLDKKDYYLADVIDNAVDILMCDEESVVHEYENIKINIDFKLFSIAMKNLLDNGIKYSPDKRVVVKTEDGKIIFENIGQELQHSLQDYYEPFFNGDNVKSNQSFGLGFYIISNILNANGFKLIYKHENGINNFIIY